MSGGAAAFVALRHANKVEALVCPGAKALVERAREAAGDAPPESRDALARLELAVIRDEATRTLLLASLVPRSMARIALASGTAFAVLALATYANDDARAATVAGFGAFAGGIFGSAASAAFGRRARASAEAARREWKRALKLAEAELEP